MKNISLTLENLSNGQIRITGRRDRAAVASLDGPKDQAREMYAKVAAETASAHMIGGVVSEKYVSISDELKAAIA